MNSLQIKGQIGKWTLDINWLLPISLNFSKSKYQPIFWEITNGHSEFCLQSLIHYISFLASSPPRWLARDIPVIHQGELNNLEKQLGGKYHNYDKTNRYNASPQHSNLRLRKTKLKKQLTNQPIYPVGILLCVLTIPQVQQVAGTPCSLLRDAWYKGTPSPSSRRREGNWLQEGRDESKSQHLKPYLTYWTNTCI